MALDLPPVLYNALQWWARGDQRDYLDLIAAAHREAGGGPALELGCGTGALSRAFGPGVYTGVDSTPARIARARIDYPHANFVQGDVTALSPEFLAGFGFIFAFAFLHHISDDAVECLLQQLAQASRARPIAFLAVDPLRPDRRWRNPVGGLIAYLDRGRWVRTHQEIVRLLGPFLTASQIMRPKLHWPIPIGSYKLQFPVRAASASEGEDKTSSVVPRGLPTSQR
jgi:SAM-dependent methyltransferase